MIGRMTRKRALAAIFAAGYHEDRKTFTRVYVENRVSFLAANREYIDGQIARRNGLRCTCHECQQAKQPATV